MGAARDTLSSSRTISVNRSLAIMLIEGPDEATRGSPMRLLAAANSASLRAFFRVRRYAAFELGPAFRAMPLDDGIAIRIDRASEPPSETGADLREADVSRRGERSAIDAHFLSLALAQLVIVVVEGQGSSPLREMPRQASSAGLVRARLGWAGLGWFGCSDSREL